MKINEFKKLEEKINGQNFNKGYKNINSLMLILSIFGHFASIFLAYFALSKVLGGVIENNPAVVLITSIIMLSGLELLKRDIFDKFSIQYLKAKAFTKDVLPLFLLSVAIISTSFYASIHGAKEFSSKEAVIEQNQKVVVNQFADSLTAIYNVKVSEVEVEIKADKEKLDLKDKEQTDLEAIQPPTRSQRNRIKDLKEERNILRTDITKLEGDVNIIKTTKFKTTRIQVVFVSKLDEKTLTARALMPYIIKSVSKKYPSRDVLSSYLEEMYSASFNVGVNKITDAHIITFDMNFIDNYYTFGNEDLFNKAIEFIKELLFSPLFDKDIFIEEKRLMEEYFEGIYSNKTKYA